MQQKRTKDYTGVLTPDFIGAFPDDGKLSREALVEQNYKLRGLLAAERRTHTTAMKVLTHHIETIEKTLGNVREAFFENINLRPGERQ
jgi:hypothetical protein